MGNRSHNVVKVEVKEELDDIPVLVRVQSEGLIDSGERSVCVEATTAVLMSGAFRDPFLVTVDDQNLSKLEIKEVCFESPDLSCYGEELCNIVSVQNRVSAMSTPSTSKDFPREESSFTDMNCQEVLTTYKHQGKLVTSIDYSHKLTHPGQMYNYPYLDFPSLNFVKEESILPPHVDMTQSGRTDVDSYVLVSYINLIKDKFVCKLCNKEYMDIERCKGHIRSHLGLRPFICSHRNCTKTFSSKDSLRSHDYLIHRAHDRFKCKMCDRTFNKRNLFTEHCNKHNAIMPFDCAICGKAFPGKESIFLHIVNVHNYGEQSHLCPKCGKVFSNRQNLRCHLRTHGEKRFKCDLCYSYFISRLKLSNHMASHSADRPFQCSLCSKSYRLKTTLQRHVSTTHEKKKNFKCAACDKSFVSGSFLREHVLKHDGVRKYSCEMCGKTFAQASHLGAHKFSHGEKKFVCSVCGAKFNRHDNMKSHVKRHEIKNKLILKGFDLFR